ncbi:hypothetical protein V8F06_014893 [Rhypophila decipiens]
MLRGLTTQELVKRVYDGPDERWPLSVTEGGNIDAGEFEGGSLTELLFEIGSLPSEGVRDWLATLRRCYGWPWAWVEQPVNRAYLRSNTIICYSARSEDTELEDGECRAVSELRSDVMLSFSLLGANMDAMVLEKDGCDGSVFDIMWLFCLVGEWSMEPYVEGDSGKCGSKDSGEPIRDSPAPLPACVSAPGNCIDPEKEPCELAWLIGGQVESPFGACTHPSRLRSRISGETNGVVVIR